MTRRGAILLASLGVIWGIPYLLIKVAVDGGVAPAAIVLARTGLGAVLLLPFAVRGGGLRVVLAHWRPALAFAVLEIVGPWLLLSNAERTLTSSTTGLLVATVPIGAVVAGRLVGDRQPVGAVRWLGLLVGLGGVVLLLGPGAAGGNPWAVTQVLLAAAGYATAPMIADRWLRDVPTVPLTAACLALAACVYAPVVAVTGPHPVPPTSAVLALVVLGVVCTALAFTLFFALIAQVGAARSTLVAYLNPVVAVTLGAAVLDEPITLGIVGATALILLGSAAASRHPAPPNLTSGPAPDLGGPDLGGPDGGAPDAPTAGRVAAAVDAGSPPPLEVTPRRPPG